MDNVLRISPYLLHEPGHLLFADELWFLPIRYYCGSRLAIVAFHQEELELEVIEEFATLLDAVSFSARKEDRNGPVLLALNLDTDAMVVPWRVRICDLPRLQLRWKRNLVTLHEADGCIEFLAQGRIRAGHDVKEFVADHPLKLRDGFCQIGFRENNGVGSSVCSAAFFVSCRLDDEHFLRKRQRQSFESCLHSLKGGSDLLLLGISPWENILPDKLQVVRFGDIFVRLHSGGTIERTHTLDKIISAGENHPSFLNGC